MLAVVASVLVPVSSASAQTGGFSDVPDDAYFSVPVATLAERGVFVSTECDDGFCPGDPIDRKTIAVWVVRLFDGEDPEAVTETRFDDVDADSFHAAFIERMAELGVTEGCGDGSGFCPDRSVSRAQMAAFLSRAYKLPEGPHPVFSDVADDAWYAAEVARLAASKITDGCGDGTIFCPERATTRAQMATFLHRAENRRVGGGLVDTAACDQLRRTPSYVYPGAPAERLDVVVVSAAFDDLDAPDFRRDEVLAAVETQLEALSRGRTDVVMDYRGAVALAGSVLSRVRATSSGSHFASNRMLVELPAELRPLYPDGDALVVLVSISHEHPYTSFYSSRGVAVIGVEQLRLRGDERKVFTNIKTGESTSRPLNDEEKADKLRRLDVARHEWAQYRMAHELLHALGLDDLYPFRNVPGPDHWSESSFMGLTSYASGWRSGGDTSRAHEPVTGWSKWLLGWLDGPEAQCVVADRPTRLVLRPHQQITVEAIRPVSRGVPLDCYLLTQRTWGPAAARPAIGIVPTSSHTALVIEVDTVGGNRPDGYPQRCGIPDDTRPDGDVIVYTADTTVRGGHLPLRVLQPSRALITDAEFEAIQERLSPWGLNASDDFATELIASGYRITVAERTVTSDGLPQVTVIIEPD